MTISPPVCKFTSCTLEELPDFLAAADVAVVPRPNSPGILTKLLNYKAAGNAIVSFKQSATILQYKVTAFRKSFRTNVQSFVIGRFDWPSIAVRLEAVYGSLAKKSRAILVNPAGQSGRRMRRRRSLAGGTR